MRWSKWTEAQKHVLSFAVFLEKIKSRSSWDVKLNCIWQLGELEEWWRVWKKASLMVMFFTAFICCCYGDWSTDVLSSCLPAQIQLGKCSQCSQEWEVKFLMLIYIPFAKCWRSKIPPLQGIFCFSGELHWRFLTSFWRLPAGKMKFQTCILPEPWSHPVWYWNIWPKSASLWIRHSSCILTFLEKIMQVSELTAWVIFYSLES